MQLAIVIVNYRSAELVGDLLVSIAQRGMGWVHRVIIVDNASGDGSIAKLNARITDLGIGQWTTVIEAGTNGGFGKGNNIGAVAALKSRVRPDVLWFLNPDTLVHDVDLQQALKWFEEDSNIAIVGTGLSNDHGDHELGGHRDVSPVGEFVRTAGAFGLLHRFSVSDKSLDRPGQVDWVSGASLMMRTTAFEQVGGFDEDFFLYFEEVDLCRRTRRLGWKVVYEPRVRVVHLEGQSTGLQHAKPRPRYWYESRRRYFVKHFGVHGLAAADAAWGLGRMVGSLRRRPVDACCWADLWQCDAPVILGRQWISTGVSE